MNRLFSFRRVAALTFVGVLMVLFTLTSAMAQPWKFGIISDTQWTKPDDGKNPNTCAADIIKQVNQQFINAGVKLVIAVGDTVDVGSATSIGTRALYAQDLYNAGVGFYPLRGNHEAAENPPDLTSGAELRHAFPQIGSGLNNYTPADINTTLIPAADLLANPPAVKSRGPFIVGGKFSEPIAVNTADKSVSYSFDYKNARFVLLDQFDMNGNYYNSTIPDQQAWIDGRLYDPARPQQAFVFVHKNLLGGNHKDNMFGGQINSTDPGDGDGVVTSVLSDADKATLLNKQLGEDAFIGSLADTNVKFCISGHDHHHYHSIVTAPFTPDKSVHQLIAQSDSSKFYTPQAPHSNNDVPLAQDLYRIGYYIVTVDGTHVGVDYYGSQAVASASSTTITTTPPLEFSKLESFGYSLNGQEFLIAQGESYTSVQDSYKHTTASILSGANSSTATDHDGRPFSKVVGTGWSPRRTDTRSDILRIWGASSDATDVYTLSISYDDRRSKTPHVRGGSVGLATKNNLGKWINAVDKNTGGEKNFVSGPYQPGYDLGTYGVDYKTHTAWAVINYNSDFSVVELRH